MTPAVKGQEQDSNSDDSENRTSQGDENDPKNDQNEGSGDDLEWYIPVILILVVTIACIILCIYKNLKKPSQGNSPTSR